MTGKMTAPELAAAKSQTDMLIWLQHTGIRVCTDRHCPLHVSKLSQIYCSLWYDRQDDKSRAGSGHNCR